jgi:hypothetical protein
MEPSLLSVCFHSYVIARLWANFGLWRTPCRFNRLVLTPFGPVLRLEKQAHPVRVVVLFRRDRSPF